MMLEDRVEDGEVCMMSVIDSLSVLMMMEDRVED